MEVRANNEPFLDVSKTFIDRLAAEVEPLSVYNGGPILMVQVENEYGSFDDDHEYTEKLRDIVLEACDQPLYTTNGSRKPSRRRRYRWRPRINRRRSGDWFPHSAEIHAAEPKQQWTSANLRVLLVLV